MEKSPSHLNLWFLNVRLAQVHFGRERSGLVYGRFAGNDEQGGRWVRGQLLFAGVLLVTVNAQFLREVGGGGQALMDTARI